jgi:hypothetical protein
MDICTQRLSDSPLIKDESLVFLDKISIVSKITSVDVSPLLWHNHCRTWPNAYQKVGLIPYDKCYATLAPCDTTYECVNHVRFGKCLLLNGGGRLPGKYSNPNVRSKCYGTMFLDEVFIHCAWSKSWPGSAGCITLHPLVYPEFISMFKHKAFGRFVLVEGPCQDKIHV